MSNLPLIQILPLPKGVLLNSNNTQVSGIDSKSIKDYKPNGSYIVSASSTANDNTNPYMVFNGSEQSFWQSDYNNNPSYNFYKAGYPQYTQDPYNSGKPSSYQGGGTAKNKWITKIGNGDKESSLSGEWIQVQIPYSIYLYKYSIMTPSYSGNISTFPLKFTLVGSTDGSSWSYLDQQNITADEMPSENRPFRIYNINAISKFSYFRLIISEMSQGMNIVRLNQLNLFGVTYITVNPDVGTEKFSLLSDNNLIMERNIRESNFTSYNSTNLDSSPYVSHNNNEKNRYEPFDTYKTTNQINSEFNGQTGYIQTNVGLLNQINTYNTSTVPTDRTNITTLENQKVQAQNAVTQAQNTVTQAQAALTQAQTLLSNASSTSSDTASLTANVQQAQTQVQTATAALRQSQTDYKTADANLTAARTKLTTDEAKIPTLTNQVITNSNNLKAAINDFQISPMIQTASNYSTLLNKIDSTYRDLSNNIGQITNPNQTGLRDQLMANDKYDFSGNLLNYMNEKPTLNDAMLEDTDTLILQQNAVFMLGTIASATLIIFAIMLLRE